MKKLTVSVAALALAAGSAVAADLPSRKAEPLPPPPPPPPMWTGFYVGLNAGGTWSNPSTNITTWNSYSSPDLNPSSGPAAAVVATGTQGANSSGFIGGGQIGYNHQFDRFVVGLEADIQGVAGSNGSARTAAVSPIPDSGADAIWTNFRSSSNRLNYLGTVRGRIGYLFTPTVLVFGSGGLAYGGVSSQTSLMWVGLPAFSFATGGDTFFGQGNYSNTQVGWTAGGGVEWMFLTNWSAKVEYLYYDLGRVNANFASIRPKNDGSANFLMGTNSSTRYNGNIVRAGVNYHFNWGSAPIVAKF